MLTVLITAGGTGGHVLPGLSVADLFSRRRVKTVWVGTRRSIEARLVPEKGIPFSTLPVKGLRGKGLFSKVSSLFVLFWGVAAAIAALLKLRPALVLGMGGYVSAPCVLAAWILKIPVVIHEQNAIAGVTNRYLAKLATKVALGYAHALPHTQKVSYVGNPVRQSIIDIPAPEKRLSQRSGVLHLLVVGGSQGARRLNQVVPKALALLKDEVLFEVVHQVGKHDVLTVEAAYKQAGIIAIVLPFIEDMAVQYKRADLVIARAGALTVAEIMAAGVASVLIPYPYAVDDHQTLNAASLVSNGAAIVLQENGLSEQCLSATLKPLAREELLAMSLAARRLSQPEATANIVELCVHAMKGNV